MATKNNSKQKEGVNWNKITQFCSFFAVCIAGLMFTINGIMKLFDASVNFGILNTIATLLLVVAVIIPGWRFSRKMPMWARILFWVAAILLIAFGAISLQV